MISLLFITFSYCCCLSDLHFSISDWFDMMSCPMCFLRPYPPQSARTHTHPHTHENHTHTDSPSLSFSLSLSLSGGGFSDNSLISHVLALNFSKGDRQLLLLASTGNHGSATGTSRTLPLSLTAKLQRDGKRILRCKIPNSHTDSATKYFITQTHEQIKYQMCSPRPAYVTRWGSRAPSSWEHFLTGIKNWKREKKRKKLEKPVYPLMSLLVCRSLSTCICGTLQNSPHVFEVRTAGLMYAAWNRTPTCQCV